MVPGYVKQILQHIKGQM